MRHRAGSNGCCRGIRRVLLPNTFAPQIETVASPAIGGIVIGYEVARQLGVRFMLDGTRRGPDDLAARIPGGMKGERVLVVEDVVTTGGSTRETIAALSRRWRIRHRRRFDH